MFQLSNQASAAETFITEVRMYWTAGLLSGKSCAHTDQKNHAILYRYSATLKTGVVDQVFIISLN